MKGLAGGIEKSRRLVEKAVKDVASDMVITPKAAVAGYGDTYGMMTGGSMSDMISGDLICRFGGTVRFFRQTGQYHDSGVCGRYFAG